MIRKGTKVRITPDNDSENYEEYRNRVLVVTGVFKNDREHLGYDMGIYPEKLYEFEGCPFALYEYEIEKSSLPDDDLERLKPGKPGRRIN